jgi:hypothetical protein
MATIDIDAIRQAFIADAKKEDIDLADAGAHFDAAFTAAELDKGLTTYRVINLKVDLRIRLKRATPLPLPGWWRRS